MTGKKGVPRPQEVRDKIRAGKKKHEAESRMMRAFYLEHKEE